MHDGKSGTSPRFETKADVQTTKVKSWANIFRGIDCLMPGESVPRNSITNKSVSFAPSVKKLKLPPKFRLPWWKVYLDSCATYHSCTVAKFQSRICKASAILKDHCNAGVIDHTKMSVGVPLSCG